jgi:hypothetical protein
MTSLLKRMAASAAGSGLVVLVVVTTLGEREPADQSPVGIAERVPLTAAGETPASSSTAPSPAPSDSGRGLYRWRDQAGVIYISTEPDLAPGYAERFALPAAVFTAGVIEDRDGRKPAGLNGLLERSPISIYSYDGLTTLIGDAGRIAHQLRSRNQLLEKLARQL